MLQQQLKLIFSFSEWYWKSPWNHSFVFFCNTCSIPYNIQDRKGEPKFSLNFIHGGLLEIYSFCLGCKTRDTRKEVPFHNGIWPLWTLLKETWQMNSLFIYLFSFARVNTHTTHHPGPFHQRFGQGLIAGCFYGREMPHHFSYKWIGLTEKLQTLKATKL